MTPGITAAVDAQVTILVLGPDGQPTAEARVRLLSESAWNLTDEHGRLRLQVGAQPDGSDRRLQVIPPEGRRDLVGGNDLRTAVFDVEVVADGQPAGDEAGEDLLASFVDVEVDSVPAGSIAWLVTRAQMAAFLARALDGDAGG